MLEKDKTCDKHMSALKKSDFEVAHRLQPTTTHNQAFPISCHSNQSWEIYQIYQNDYVNCFESRKIGYQGMKLILGLDKSKLIRKVINWKSINQN